jgi:formate dehydrogenase subunit gamma
MRVRGVLILLVLLAVVFVGLRFLPNRNAGPARLEEIKTACQECHGSVPDYDGVAIVHGRHATFACARCHGEAGAMKAAKGFRSVLEGVFIGFAVLAIVGLMANQRAVNRRIRAARVSEPRTVRRFRGRSILVHWLHVASFAVLLITGILMIYGLTDMDTGWLVRTIHKTAAVGFVIVPVLFTLFDPRAAFGFLKDGFRWNRNDWAWLRDSPAFYFGQRSQMPRQGYINGDQRLWQLVTIVTGLAFTTTGVFMWLFRMKVPPEMYVWVRLAHAASFVIAGPLFLFHAYIALLHPRFEESMSSMIDGKVSLPYARDHYAGWCEDAGGAVQFGKGSDSAPSSAPL